MCGWMYTKTYTNRHELVKKKETERKTVTLMTDKTNLYYVYKTISFFLCTFSKMLIYLKRTL